MARLNESIPPESLLALKKRFIRQNRELAKANTLQSLRIRTLESEVCRVLTENLELKSKINNLKSQVDTVQYKNYSSKILKAKTELNLKLNEIHDIISNLDAPAVIEPVSPFGQSMPIQIVPEEAILQSHPQSNISLRGWKSCAEAKLPTIIEGKSFPRKTLSPDEIEHLDTDGLNEDDLEPLPDTPGCYAVNGSPPHEYSPEINIDLKNESHSPHIPNNSKSSKKVRSRGKLEIRRLIVFPDTPASDNSPMTSLSSPKDSSHLEPLLPAGNPHRGFCGNNQHSSSEFVHDNFDDNGSLDSLPPDDITQDKLIPILSAPLTPRKALMSKSVNEDFTSPRKIKNNPEIGAKAKKTSVNTDESRSIPPKGAILTAKSNKPRRTYKVYDPAHVHNGPKIIAEIVTHDEATSDTVTSTGKSREKRKVHSVMSEARNSVLQSPCHAVELLDSPIEKADNTNCSLILDQSDRKLDNAQLPSRPARRSRPQVNYAEPSLVKKLRRPGGLVDAVQPGTPCAGANGIDIFLGEKSQRFSGDSITGTPFSARLAANKSLITCDGDDDFDDIDQGSLRQYDQNETGITPGATEILEKPGKTSRQKLRTLDNTKNIVRKDGDKKRNSVKPDGMLNQNSGECHDLDISGSELKADHGTSSHQPSCNSLEIFDIIDSSPIHSPSLKIFPTDTSSTQSMNNNRRHSALSVSQFSFNKTDCGESRKNRCAGTGKLSDGVTKIGNGSRRKSTLT